MVFNGNGVIEDIYNALPKWVYNRLIQEGEDVKDIRCRQQVIQFLEQYQTAFARKDLTYLNKFCNIMGCQNQKSTDCDTSSRKKKKLSKKTDFEIFYSKFKPAFESNDYLNNYISDVELVRHTKVDNVYGLSFEQKLNNNTYNEAGYHFIMIDFLDVAVIDTWCWSPCKKYKLSDFKIQ